MMLKRLIMIVVVGLILTFIPYGVSKQREYQAVSNLIQKGSLIIETSSLDIPPEIGKLQYMRELHITANQLTQLTPKIGKLQYMRELHITANQLTQLIPEIGNLQRLEWLEITANQLTQLPPEIGNLQNLKELSITANQLTQLPTEIAQLQNLKELSITANQLTQLPTEIAQLQNLEALHITANQLTQLTPEIGNLQRLEWLEITANQLTQLPPEIGNLQSLQSLSITANQLTQLPPEIGQLQNLKVLDITANQLTQLPTEITQLQNLQYLYITANQLTQLPTEITQLQNLSWLSITANQLTQLPTEISNRNNIVRLSITANQLTQLPPEIGNLQNLYVLSITANQLTQLPPEIGNLYNLEELSINSNQLTQLPTEFGNLHNLEELSITSEQLKTLPTEITQLQSLYELHITANLSSILPPEMNKKIVTLTLPESTFPNIYVFWGIGLIVGVALFIWAWRYPRPIHLALSTDKTSDTKTKQNTRLPIYRWRFLTTLVASVVCSIPLFTYIADNFVENMNYLKLPPKDERIILVMGVCYLVAWVVTVFATQQVSHALKIKEHLESEQPFINGISVWKATVQKTLGWHLALVIPRYGLAYGFTQLFFTHFDPTCLSLNQAKVFVTPYCYSGFNLTILPSWQSALVTLGVLLLLAIAECGLISAIASISATWKSSLLRRTVWAWFAISAIIFYSLYGFKEVLQLRQYGYSREYHHAYSDILLNNFEHSPEHANGWFDTHIVGMSLVDNGVLLASNIMRDLSPNRYSQPYQTQYPNWLGHQVLLGLMSSGVFALITAYYLVYLRKPIVLREEHTS